MKKRFLAALLCLCMAFALFPTTAFAGDETFVVDDITYKVLTAPSGSTPGTVQVGDGKNPAIDTNFSASLDIPASVNSVGGTYNVVAIGEKAFFNCDGLTDVTIPAGVTKIGNAAFCACTCLEVVTIPEGVIDIGPEAFLSCDALTSVTLPASVSSIGERAFSACNMLTSITVKSNNAHFKDVDGVLYNKAGDVLLCCPSGKSGAFAVPAGVVGIGSDAFYFCRQLTSINLPESVIAIEHSAFWACEKLDKINIPQGVSAIPNSLFTDCISLRSLTIPAGVTSIGNRAFNGCKNLVELNFMGLNAPTLGGAVFLDCSRQGMLYYPAGATGYAGFGDGTPIENWVRTPAYFVTATAGAGGEISPVGANRFSSDENPAFFITPTADYAVADVLVDGISVGPVGSYTFNTLTGSQTIEAVFTDETYAVIVNNGTGGGNYAQRAVVKITAGTAPAGQQFKEWVITPAVTFVEGTSAKSETAKFDMPARNVTATATYEAIQTYHVTVNGSHTAANGAGDYKPGDIVTIHASSRSSDAFVGWTVEKGSVTLSDPTSTTTSFTMPATNVTVKANWSDNRDDTDDCRLTFETNGGSDIPFVRTSAYTTVDLTLSKYIPTRAGFEFIGWYSNKNLTAKITSIRLTKNTTIYAKWSDKSNPSTGFDNPFIDFQRWTLFEDMTSIFQKG
ncbi:MAG: leucine-rich repeat protein [Oscillospiraceae bacterium]|nr:leucine-rich repeat protein [Oscillospiraceae bacterium]